jgi:hypothetical protein
MKKGKRRKKRKRKKGKKETKKEEKWKKRDYFLYLSCVGVTNLIMSGSEYKK